MGEGWTKSDEFGGWSCAIDQAWFGHYARKASWLYAVGTERPDLIWQEHPQILPQWMIDRYGYEKARKTGQVAMTGGKDKERIRNATPYPFADLLIGLARSVSARGCA